MTEIVIVSAARTPVGSFNGALSGVSADASKPSSHGRRRVGAAGHLREGEGEGSVTVEGGRFVESRRDAQGLSAVQACTGRPCPHT